MQLLCQKSNTPQKLRIDTVTAEVGLVYFSQPLPFLAQWYSFCNVRGFAEIRSRISTPIERVHVPQTPSK